MENEIHWETQCPDTVGVQFDPDLPFKAAPDVDLRHTGDSGEAVTDLVFNQLRQFHGVQVTGDSQQDDRKTGDIKLPDPGPHNVFGELVDLVFEFTLDIQSGRINTRTPGKTDPDTAAPLGRLRRHFLDARHRRNDLFNDLGDQPLHDLGTGPFVLGSDGQCRQFNVGQQVNPQPAQRDGSEDHDNQRHHGDKDGSPNAESRQAHFRGASLGVESVLLLSPGIVIFEPSSTSCCPRVTT